MSRGSTPASRGQVDHRDSFSVPALTASDGDRRQALSRLDGFLDQLEAANLREQRNLPRCLLDELRALGLSHPESLTPTELIDMVLRAQEPLLKSAPPAVPISLRVAAVRAALTER